MCIHHIRFNYKNIKRHTLAIKFLIICNILSDYVRDKKGCQIRSLYLKRSSSFHWSLKAFPCMTLCKALVIRTKVEWNLFLFHIDKNKRMDVDYWVTLRPRFDFNRLLTKLKLKKNKNCIAVNLFIWKITKKEHIFRQNFLHFQIFIIIFLLFYIFSYFIYLNERLKLIYSCFKCSLFCYIVKNPYTHKYTHRTTSFID